MFVCFTGLFTGILQFLILCFYGVCVCVCVSVFLLSFPPFKKKFGVCLFVWLCPNDREKEMGRICVGREAGEVWGGAEGGETVIRICRVIFFFYRKEEGKRFFLWI